MHISRSRIRPAVVVAAAVAGAAVAVSTSAGTCCRERRRAASAAAAALRRPFYPGVGGTAGNMPWPEDVEAAKLPTRYQTATT